MVDLVQNFYLSTRSSSCFLAFFLRVYGEPVQETPYTNASSRFEQSAMQSIPPYTAPKNRCSGLRALQVEIMRSTHWIHRHE